MVREPNHDHLAPHETLRHMRPIATVARRVKLMRAKHLPIASPCDEDWDAMRPTGCGKFCQACEKPVYDLSAMTEKQARTLLAKNAKREICISYLADARGNVSFRVPKNTAPVVAAAVVATALAACTPIHNADVVQEAQPTAIELDQPVEDVMVPLAERVNEPVEPVEVEPVKEPEPELQRVKGDWAGPIDEPCDPPEAEKKDPKIDRSRVKGKMPVHSISIE